MAMTALNSSAAQLSLGELNKNINKVGKALTMISTGQKLNSAADDAASFSISEVMRAKIRALEQDVNNVQNGSSMIKTAAGGIDNIVSELRNLKELAIDAANDSNTDEDRRVLQKMFEQKRANINDIAVDTNYNTKRLLDGTYTYPSSDIDYVQIGIKARTTVIGKPPGVSKIPQQDSGTTIIQDNRHPEMYNPFSPVADDINKKTQDVRSYGEIECDFGFKGSSGTWSWGEYFRYDDAIISGPFALEVFNEPNASQQKVIEGFMKSLGVSKRNSVDNALDDAIKAVTNGAIDSLDKLKTAFINDLQSNPNTFLSTYCGIDLANNDTGAITGAINGTLKDADSIVPEPNVGSWTLPTSPSGSFSTGSSTLNVTWPTTGTDGVSPLSSTESDILSALNSDWISESLGLVEASFGLDYNDTITIAFVNGSSSGALASLNNSTLSINMTRCASMTLPSGQVGSDYLDRTIAREFAKAAMAIPKYNSMPSYMKEGLADLTTGADDIRAADIQALISDPNRLQSLLSNSRGTSSESAAAGYIFMRYLAQQSAGNNITVKTVKFSPEPAEKTPIGVNIDFDLSKVTSLSDIDGDGFAILCRGCPQYINFVFDSSITASQSTFDRDPTDRNKSDYRIGIGDVDLSDPDDLARAIFEGVASCTLTERNSTASRNSDIFLVDASTPPNEERVAVVIDGNHGVRIAKKPSGDGYIFLKDDNIEMDFLSKGAILAIEYPGETDDIHGPLDTDTEIHIGPPIYDYVEYTKRGNPLTIHHSTKSYEAINVYIRDMKTSALKSPVPSLRDLDYLLDNKDFLQHNPELVDKTTNLKSALEQLTNDLNQLKRSPLAEIIDEIDDVVNKSINDKSLGLKSALDEYPVLRQFFEASIKRPTLEEDSSTTVISSLVVGSDTTIKRVFDIDTFIGRLREYPSLQPMLESAIINHAILSSTDPKAGGETIDTIRDAMGKTLDDISLTQRRSAQTAIRVIDGALEYALGEATNVGANLARLEYTEANIVTDRDNVTAAESVLRDADMAKELTQYTKYNLLQQASQSMLAQTNQNLSGVLSLIQ